MCSQMKTFTAAGGGANAAFVHRSSRNRHETKVPRSRFNRWIWRRLSIFSSNSWQERELAYLPNCPAIYSFNTYCGLSSLAVGLMRNHILPCCKLADVGHRSARLERHRGAFLNLLNVKDISPVMIHRVSPQPATLFLCLARGAIEFPWQWSMEVELTEMLTPQLFIAAVSGQDSTSLCGEPHVEALVCFFSKASGFESLHENMLRVLPLLAVVM